MAKQGPVEEMSRMELMQDWHRHRMLIQLTSARRIVAAINACQGIPTEALESGALGKALGVLEAGAQPPGTNTVKGLRQLSVAALRSLGMVK